MIAEPHICLKNHVVKNRLEIKAGEIYWAPFSPCADSYAEDWLTEFWRPYADFEMEKLKELKIEVGKPIEVEYEGCPLSKK